MNLHLFTNNIYITLVSTTNNSAAYQLITPYNHCDTMTCHYHECFRKPTTVDQYYHISLILQTTNVDTF